MTWNRHRQRLRTKQVKTGYEDSSHNITYSVCTQYADSQGLWSSPSSLSHNSCVEVGTFDKDFISLPPESHFQSFQKPICSNNQLPKDEFTESSYNELQIPFTKFLVQPKQFMNTTIPSVNGKSAFVEWRIYRPLFTSLQPTKSQSLHKRGISFLNCVKSHKSSSLNTNNGGKPGLNVNHKIAEKLAIRHAARERKRREEMKKIGFALRAVLPAYSKVWFFSFSLLGLKGILKHYTLS